MHIAGLLAAGRAILVFFEFSEPLFAGAPPRFVVFEGGEVSREAQHPAG